VDVELHTHRHRTPSDEKLFRREIRDNLTGIQALTGQRACHFCYPSGVYLPSFFPWLADEGVVSATTCKPGIVARPAPIWELPRYVDTMYQGMADFSCWVSGVAGLLR
jgi:peptidoglycan/xylan/chitin deacetylase (PgdA/CDA1 family)